MSEVKFALSMTDKLSGPVKNAASAVEQLLGSTKKAGSSLGMMGAQTEKLVGSTQGAASAIAAIDGKMSALVSKKIELEFNSARLVGQTASALASIKALDMQIAGLTMRKVDIETAGGSGASLAVGKLEEQIAKIQGRKINIEVDIAKANASNELLKLSTSGLDAEVVNQAQELAEAEWKAAKEAQAWAAAVKAGGSAKHQALLNQQRDASHTSMLSGLFGSGAAAGSVATQFGGLQKIFGSDGTFNGGALFSKGIGWIGKTFGQGTSDSVLKLAQGAAKADTALQGMGMSLGGVVAAGTGAAVVGIGAVVVAAGAAVAAIGALTYKFVELGVQGAAAFTKFAVSSLSFRENTMVAFKTLTDSQKLADDVYGKAVKFAAATPFNTDTVVGAYQKLLVGGFKVDELETMMNAIGDVAAMKGMNPQVIEQMVAGFAKMKGLGKLTGEVLDMEAFQGISGKIKDELGLQLGKSSDEIAKMIGGGKIDATTAQKAILEVIRKTYSGGTLGGAMADFSKTWEGMWSNLTSRPSELFQAASLEKDSGVQRMFGTLTKLGNVFVEALDPKSASGKKITGLINSVGDTLNAVYGKGVELAKVFWKSMEGSTGDKILGTFRDVGAAIKAAFGNIDSKSFGQWVDKWLPAIVSGLGGFAKGLATSFGSIGKMLNLDTGGDPEKLAKSFGSFGETFGKNIGNVVGGVVMLTMAFGKLVEVMTRAVDIYDRIFGKSNSNSSASTFSPENTSESPSILDTVASAAAPSWLVAAATKVLPSGTSSAVAVPSLPSLHEAGGVGGNKTQNNTVSIVLSGVGLDLPQLADMIKRGVTDAMLQVVPA